MLIEFDPDKEVINRTKHRISLAEAALLNWDSALVWPDTRFDYGEERMSALGCIETRLYYVAFVDRDYGDESNFVRRIISLRKATKTEEKFYARI